MSDQRRAPARECHDWQAFHDFQPGRPPRLRVTGECTFPTPGYQVELRRRPARGVHLEDEPGGGGSPSGPPGPTPLPASQARTGVLVLERVTRQPDGFVPQVLTTQRVTYEEETHLTYTAVLIVPDGVSLQVQKVR